VDMSRLKKESVPQRGGASGRPIDRPASRRRATAWRPQTGLPTGRAAAPRTLRLGRRGPQRCGAPDRPVGRLRHEIQEDSGRIDCHNQIDQVNRLHDVLREALQVSDDILTYDGHMIDISQNGKWHIPEWKVAYAKME
jgi:hypothetical protein